MSDEDLRVLLAQTYDWKLLKWKDPQGNDCSGWRSPDGRQCSSLPPLAVLEISMNVTIAESDGWLRARITGVPHWSKNGKLVRSGELPDYLYDLNAVNRIELSLPEADIRTGAADRVQFRFNLGVIRGSCHGIIHASARERAIAYLVTIGKLNISHE